MVLSGADVPNLLPVKPANAAVKRSVSGKFTYVNVCDDLNASSFDLKLNISEKKSESGEDFIISGNVVDESASWEDIGADPAVFGKIGELVRVNNVVQILAGTDSDGTLKYYTLKQGQIIYIKNRNNLHYGFDILLGSKNLAIAPTVR